MSLLGYKKKHDEKKNEQNIQAEHSVSASSCCQSPLNDRFDSSNQHIGNPRFPTIDGLQICLSLIKPEKSGGRKTGKLLRKFAGSSSDCLKFR